MGAAGADDGAIGVTPGGISLPPDPGGMVKVGMPMMVAERGGRSGRLAGGSGGGTSGGGRSGGSGSDRAGAELGDALARDAGERLDDLVEQHLGVPRLDHVAVGAALLAARVVVRLRVAAHDEDRNAREIGIRLDRLAQVVAGLARHDRVGEDQRRPLGARQLERLVRALGADVLVVAAAEGDLGDLLHGGAVVGAENRLAHDWVPSRQVGAREAGFAGLL